MKISVKLFEAIINGSLDPNSQHNTNNTIFAEILADKVRASKDDPVTFFKELKRASKLYFPYMELADCDNLTKYNLTALPDCFSKLTPKSYFDKITEFYTYLISNETERLFISLSNTLYDKHEFIDRAYHTKSLKNSLDLIFRFLGEKNWSSKQSVFVLDTLKIKVYYLYKALLHHYGDYCENTELTDAEILNDLFPTSDSVDWSNNHAYKIINEFIVENQKNPVLKPQIIEETVHVPQLKSFFYKDFDKRITNIEFVFLGLFDNGFISKNTTKPNFYKVFKNTEITNPIVWTGTVSDLHYFIKLIHNVYKYVADTKQKQYIIASQCFVSKDGTPFNFKTLKTQKKPNSTAKLLEKIVKNLA